MNNLVNKIEQVKHYFNPTVIMLLVLSVGVGILVGFEVFIWLIMGWLLCFWVTRDAEARDVDSTILLTIIFMGPIGLIIYLLSGKGK